MEEWSGKSKSEASEKCLFFPEVEKQEGKWEALKERYSDEGDGKIKRKADQQKTWKQNFRVK